MNRHARVAIGFLLWHLAAGVAGAVIFGGLVLWFDIGHLRSLAMRTDQPALVIALLLFGLVVTFGSCAMAVGVMGMGRGRDRPED